MVWRMPPETAAHERTWMAFPREGYTLGSTGADARGGRRLPYPFAYTLRTADLAPKSTSSNGGPASKGSDPAASGSVPASGGGAS